MRAAANGLSAANGLGAAVNARNTRKATLTDRISGVVPGPAVAYTASATQREPPGWSLWRAAAAGQPKDLSREVDPHHCSARAGVAYLREAGVGEYLAAADVQFAPGDLLARLGDHRVGLQRPSALLAGVTDRGVGERVGDPALAVTLAGHEAGDGPDAVVRLIFLAAAPHGPHSRQA